eukprot:g315.t1
MKCVSLLSINHKVHRKFHEPLKNHLQWQNLTFNPTQIRHQIRSRTTPPGFTLAAFSEDKDLTNEEEIELADQEDDEIETIEDQEIELEASIDDDEIVTVSEGDVVDEADSISEGYYDDGEDSRDNREFDEKIVDLRRVCKTVKGGRNVSFRVVMVIGDGKGTVGVGNASAKQIGVACRKATLQAKRSLITVPLSPEDGSFPHFYEAKFSSAKVMLRPAREGTGVIAGGAVRLVLEAAGVRNGFGKILNSGNAMNVAKATIKGLASMRTVQEVVNDRGVSVDYLLGNTIDLSESALPPELQSDPEMQPVVQRST